MVSQRHNTKSVIQRRQKTFTKKYRKKIEEKNHYISMLSINTNHYLNCFKSFTQFMFQHFYQKQTQAQWIFFKRLYMKNNSYFLMLASLRFSADFYRRNQNIRNPLVCPKSAITQQVMHFVSDTLIRVDVWLHLPSMIRVHPCAVLFWSTIPHATKLV